MAHNNRPKNFDLLSGYNFFIPNPGEIFALLLLLLGGALLGNGIVAILLLFIPGLTMDAITLISYPIMFIPVMLYAKFRSQRNFFFGEGVSMDSDRHYGKIGFPALAAMVMIATIATAFLADIINSRMPEMPKWLEERLNAMTSGNIILNFICVSLFAPFFEELLCRGLVLRGLLNCKRKPAADGVARQGIKPIWAIVISAVFFAVIHMNPWQAVPAFIFGCLFGYVYYRTGSLKLTMCMHFANNTFSLIFSNIDKWKDANNWLDIMPLGIYCIFAAIAAAYLWIFIKSLNSIKLDRAQGNCDRIVIGEEL